MIKQLIPLPPKVTIAFSGGVDSVAIFSYLKKRNEVECAFFNHGTSECDNAEQFVIDFCQKNNTVLHLAKISNDRGSKSLEEHWRDERYAFLSQFETVVTGHNLDDCVETYLWSMMHGTAKVIPLYRNNIVRPFLTTSKKSFVKYCILKNQEWYEDKSNQDQKHMRNFVRHTLLPNALHVNPGLHKVVKRIVEKKIGPN